MAGKRPAIVVLSTLVVAGCGSGRLDREHLIARAKAICTTYTAKQNDVPFPSADPTARSTSFRERAMWGAALDQIVLLGRQEMTALRKLRPPKELEADWEKLLAAKDAGYDATAASANAAKRNRPEKLKKIGRTARAKLATVTKLADELGLMECA